ncbi:WD40-repeat-containing domain protein [Scleroderma yunnanense]
MPKEICKTAARSSGNSTHSPDATAPPSGESSTFIKLKLALKRFCTWVLPCIPKEVTTLDEATGSLFNHGHGNGRRHESEGPRPDKTEMTPAPMHFHESFDVPGHVEPVQPALKGIQDADKILTDKSIPGPVQAVANAIGVANTAMTQLDTIRTTYLQPLGVFNTVVNGIANIHPYARMALTTLTTASNLILSQTNLDASIGDLISKIKQIYELILENKVPSKINTTKDVLVQLAQIVQECAHFVANYSETKNFWHRLGKNIFSETTTKVANYTSKLDKLMQEFRDRAVLDIEYSVQQTYEAHCLDSLACAGRVGLDQEKLCLNGTRIKILKEILDWINNTDPATPRIFWLYGQAGKGKSAIAHTIALQAQNLGTLGSCFCFSHVRQHEELHLKLFPTIARDLADRDLRLRPHLAAVVALSHSLKDTADVVAQWQKFIFEPLAQVKDSSTGNVVIVIDALDESGSETTRKAILRIFNTHGAKLPENVRILLTSRPLVDIRDALHASQHIHPRSLDDIDAKSTIRDIHLYITTQLKTLSGTFSDKDFQQLAEKSSGVFEWARLACDFIHPRVGVIPRRRFREIMSHAPGDGRTLLDEMYTTFLKDLLNGSQEVLLRFRSVMRQILWLKEPLPISALNFMRDNFPHEDDRYPVGIILNFMASLLTGTSELFTPVRPLHASFYDFLLDDKRSGVFFIDKADVQHNLAYASLRVMQDGLRFNICGLPTSYVRNSGVADLAERVEENIPIHLLYSCRFWANHLQDSVFDVELAHRVKKFVTGEWMLFWLEALGVSKLIGEAYGALSTAERWLQGKTDYEDVLMFLNDGIKFVKNFAGIIDESTPHLYLSALPFSPSRSILARSLTGKFGNIAQVAVGQHEDWPMKQHVLQGQTPIWSVAFSPDGRHIVSGSSDHTVQLWDAHTGGQVATFQGHTDSVWSVAFSSDGRYIVSSSGDGTIQIWNVQTGGQVIKPLQGHASTVWSVAFSPDGRYIVSGSADYTVKLWDVQLGGQVGNPFQGHTDSVKSVAFSPDGKHVVSGSDDCTIKLWDVQSGGQISNTLKGHSDSVWSVAFSPDGRYVVSGSWDQTVRLWDAQTGSQLGDPLQGHTSSVFSVAFSLDGRYIVSGSHDYTIQFWDAQTGNQVANSLQGHTSSVTSVAVSPDGKHIASGSHDCTIQLWDAQTIGQVENPLQGHTSSVWSVVFSPDGGKIASGSGDCTIQLWDAQTGGQVINPLQGHTSSVFSVAFSPEGRYIVSGSRDHTIQLWDAQTGNQVGNPIKGHTSSVWSVAFSPDGRYIVSGSHDCTIQLWNVQTGGQVIKPLQGHTSSVWSVAFSPDGRYIVSGSADNTIRLWDTQSGSQVGNSFQGHTKSVLSVAFSPDGRHVVSGSHDCTIRLWNAHTGGQVGYPLQGHTSSVWSVAFSPDGGHIVSGSWDKTIRLWDVQTGSQLGNPLQGHTASVFSAAFSLDGRNIVSGSDDCTIQLWDVQTTMHNSVITSPVHFSSSVEHALQDVQSLFTKVSTVKGDSRDFIQLQKDGWIVGPNGQLLLWVPPSYHSFGFYTPWTRLVIPRGVPELDLSKMVHGSTWHECYSVVSKDD